MAEDATDELMLTILRDLQEGQRTLRDEQQTLRKEMNERFEAVDERLDTIETTVSGLAGMIALAYGKRLKSRTRPLPD